KTILRGGSLLGGKTGSVPRGNQQSASSRAISARAAAPSALMLTIIALSASTSSGRFEAENVMAESRPQTASFS
ncbi:hypothetical protein, partial [Rhizobium sp. FKY42]|uniref:hypothetical protein n=1 Tax=Rhizobium sp. FKY42 TaxID=2562310 RepID=UPI00197D6EAF